MGFVSHASAATEFVSIVDTGNGSGTDYTSLNAWETGVQTDLTAATTLVFAGTKTGTMADNASVTGASSLATATIVHATSTQILLENISGTFQNGEQIQIDGSNYFTTSNTGDSAIAIAKCRASTGVSDTTAVVIDGWTTSATNYIKIWTDPTEGYRHQGKWDDTKYRLDITDGSAISISEDFVKIDGLQAKVTSSSEYSVFGFRAYNLPSGSHTWISNNIIIGVLGGTTYGEGITMNYYDNPSDPARIWDIWNNVVYGFNTSGSNGIVGNSGDSIFLVRIYNNTVYDCDGGIGGGEDYILKNNISYNNNADYFWVPNASSTNNLSSDNSAPDYGTYYRNATVTFADETNKDFHLAQSDIDAKNVGYDLSADADLPIATDIDGSTRTGTWDIGADEAAIPVFYSVGQNTNDHKTGSPNLTIASGVGTFSVAQTGTNMGVGDKVTYDTSTVAYISEKISTTEWKLITATGGTPANITDSTVVSIAHPFASLSAALPSSPGGSKGASYLNTADLVTGNYQLNIPCYYDTGADTTAVDINGWTTGAANYIKVYTPNNTTTEVNQSQRHSGKWDEGRYRLENTLFGGTAIIGISEEYTRIEGLQVQVSVNGAVIGTAIKTYFDNVNSDTRISNNIIKVGSLINSPTGVIGIGRQADVIQKLSIWNNIIYDFTTGSAGHGLYVAANADYSASKTYIYNNTFYNIYIGIHTTSYANPIAINNIIKNSSDAYDGTFAAGTDYNATDGTDNIGEGSHNRISQTFTFADEANDDFHLVLEDTGARSFGVNLFADAYLPVKDDIDGQTRGEPWDIGADQYQGAVANSGRNLPASLESGLIGYWSFDSPDTTWTSDTTGTTNDLSSNNYDGTLTNMLKAASPIGGISGQGFNFRGQDAAADNVSITHGTAFDSVDITYSAWIKPDTISNWDAITEVTPTQDYFGLYNGQYSIWGRCGNIYLGHTIKRNQWAFVAYVISGENYSLYEDGELIASGSGCSTSTTNHGLLKIGARSDDSMGFDGVIDEVRVYSRALSIDEVIQLYKLNAGKGKPNSVLSKTAGLSSGLVGHWSFDGPDTAWTSATAGTTNDLSGNSNTGTMTNMSRSASPVFGKLGQALKFDGVNDYINLGSASSLDDIQTTGTGMSIGMWVKNNQYTYSQPMLIGKGNANYNGYWHLFLDNNDPSIRFMKDFSGSSDLSVRADYPNTYLGQFKHIVLTWDGSSSASNVHFYIDGLEVSKISSVDGDGSAVSDAALNVSMGLSVIDSTLPFNGLMDEIRIYNRVLSADEVADLYQIGQMKILK